MFKLAPLTVRPISDELARSWVAPLRQPGIRRDALAVMRGIAPEHMLGAVDGLRRFDRPAIVLWGLRDVFFKVADGQRLIDTLPQARLETVEAARTFVELDAPERVAELVLVLATATATVAAPADRNARTASPTTA